MSSAVGPSACGRRRGLSCEGVRPRRPPSLRSTLGSLSNEFSVLGTTAAPKSKLLPLGRLSHICLAIRWFARGWLDEHNNSDDVNVRDDDSE